MTMIQYLYDSHFFMRYPMKSITFTILERFESIQQIEQRIPLKTKEELLYWAIDCLDALFKLVHLGDEAQSIVLQVKQYHDHPIKVQEGRKLALRIHALARQETDPIRIFTYRALGHSIATIHVNSHAYGMALYSLKAYYEMGYSMEQLLQISTGYAKRLG